MANTYVKLYIQFVFAVQNRKSLIKDSWKNELYKYISGIVEKNGHKLMAINGVADHVHLLVSMNPKQSPSDFMFNVKRSSSIWINNEKEYRQFNWQEGYGAFSYHESQKDVIVKYINNQEKHHKKRNLRQEYLDFLDEFGIEYNEKYILKSVL